MDYNGKLHASMFGGENNKKLYHSEKSHFLCYDILNDHDAKCHITPNSVLAVEKEKITAF